MAAIKLGGRGLVRPAGVAGEDPAHRRPAPPRCSVAVGPVVVTGLPCEIVLFLYGVARPVDGSSPATTPPSPR